MGFLDKLWDETLAGPTPESGLGKLRKYNSFSAVRSPNHPLANIAPRHYHHRRGRGVDDHELVLMHGVSRSITILRPKKLLVNHGSESPDPGSGSGSGSRSGVCSPDLSSGPPSPFSPRTSYEEDPMKKGFTRRKKMLDPMEHAEYSSPIVYD